MARTKTSLEERILKLKYELLELHEEYLTRLYFETMPEYDPSYKYCYATSNMYIPYEKQSVDGWLRAVKRHMATRRRAHGGGKTSAIVVSIPTNLSSQGVEQWVSYASEKLRKSATKN